MTGSMIKSSLMPKSQTYEYSINFWIFISDWTYNYGLPKCILYRGDPNCNNASPMIFLYPETNNLMIRFSNERNKDIPLNPFKCNQKDSGLYNPSNTCDVSNIPLQKWVQISVVLWNTTTDIYINGKLARSCTHSSIPYIMDGSNLYVTQGGGFNGYISRLQYFNYSIDALKAYKLYMLGPVKKEGLFKSFKIDCPEKEEDDKSQIPDSNSFSLSGSGSCS